MPLKTSSPSDTIDLTSISSVGNRTHNVLIVGSPNTTVKFVIKNHLGETYSSKAERFQDVATAEGINILTTTIGSDGEVHFPFYISHDTTDVDATSNPGDFRYSVSIRQSQNYVLGKNVKTDLDGDVAYIENNITRTINFIPSSITIDGSARTAVFHADLSCTKTGSIGENSFEEVYSVSGFNQSGTVTAAADPLLYVRAVPILPSATTGHGSFDEMGYERVVVSQVFQNFSVSSDGGSLGEVTNTKLFFEGTTPLLLARDQDLIWGSSLKSYFKIDNVGADARSLTVQSRSGNTTHLTNEPLKVVRGDVLYISRGGHAINVIHASITGTGTTSLTASYKGHIDRFGHDQGTNCNWNMSTQISAKPNAYNMAIDCSISEATTTFAVQDGNGAPLIGDSGTCSKSSTNVWTCTVQQDIDANKNTKTYALVSKSGMTVGGELKGTIGKNSASFNDDLFYTGSLLKDHITFKYAAGSAGDTCSFTYKANDGTTDSETKTVTITLTA